MLFFVFPLHSVLMQLWMSSFCYDETKMSTNMAEILEI
jgi:hypothetical protein